MTMPPDKYVRSAREEYRILREEYGAKLSANAGNLDATMALVNEMGIKKLNIVEQFKTARRQSLEGHLEEVRCRKLSCSKEKVAPFKMGSDSDEETVNAPNADFVYSGRFKKEVHATVGTADGPHARVLEGGNAVNFRVHCTSPEYSSTSTGHSDLHAEPIAYFKLRPEIIERKVDTEGQALFKSLV